MKILLIDDQAIAKKAAATLLQQLGHEVETAENGIEAMRAITLHKFDLVFLDIEMPDMDGYQTARALRRLRPNEKAMRIFALTATASAETTAKACRAGMNGAVAKPLRRDIFEHLDGAPKQRAANGDLLDATVVADLRLLNDENGQPLLSELVRRYQADLPNRLQGLWNAYEQRDLFALQQNAHALRSCSLTLGAVGVSRAAEPIERMRAIDNAVFQTSMQSVQRAARECLVALNSQG